MPLQKTFGRRAVAQPRKPPASVRSAAPISPMPMAASDPVIEAASTPLDAAPVDVDAEVEAWKRARKAKKRSFREPWRTLAIVSSVGFGLSTWLLPDSVAAVVGYVTLGLCGGSFYAGLRTRGPVPMQDPV